MGAAHRICVRAVVLAITTSALVSLALPACQFPAYGIASGGSGSAGTSQGGTSGDLGGAAGERDEAGSGADGGDAGKGEAGAGGDAGGAGGQDTPPVPSCAVQSCVAGPPAGWLGPIAFWEGVAGAPNALPSCPRGYADPLDLHRDLNAPDGACTCTCNAQDQVCNTPLHIYSDKSCATSCATASAPEQACNVVPAGCVGSQGSMRNDPPTVSGGMCAPKVPAPLEPSWRYNARICQPSGTCEDSNQVCAPTPPLPYVTKRCVASVVPEGQALPACPAEYPNPNDPLYESIADTRGCSPCTCSDVSGGKCSGTVVLSSFGNCSGTANFTVDLGCQLFDLGPGSGVHPASVTGQYTVVGGTCSVANPSVPTGEAKPSGRAIIVCCQ